MSREAMKLALEALEGIHPGNMTPMAEEYWNKAITALREAQAEQPAQQEPVAIALNTGTKQGVKWLKNVEHGKSLYTSPQPAQQEPIIKSYLKKDNSQPVKWSDYEPDGMHHQQKPCRQLQNNGSKYFGESWDKAEQAFDKPQKRPQNCGTGYCSCIECVMETAQGDL